MHYWYIGQIILRHQVSLGEFSLTLKDHFLSWQLLYHYNFYLISKIDMSFLL